MRTSLSSNRSLSRTGLGALTRHASVEAASASMSGRIINFNNFTAQAQANGGTFNVASPHSVQGFTFTTDFGFMAAAENSDYGDGETSLFSNDGGPVTLTQGSEGEFDFNAIDLGPLYGNSGITRYTGPVMFTGTRADGTTMTAIQTITSTRFQTFSFTGFTNLTLLTFVGTFNGSTGSIPLFDNVVLAANAPAAPALEASTIVPFGLLPAFGGAGLCARKRKAAKSASSACVFLISLPW